MKYVKHAQNGIMNEKGTDSYSSSCTTLTKSASHSASLMLVQNFESHIPDIVEKFQSHLPQLSDEFMKDISLKFEQQQAKFESHITLLSEKLESRLPQLSDQLLKEFLLKFQQQQAEAIQVFKSQSLQNKSPSQHVMIQRSSDRIGLPGLADTIGCFSLPELKTLQGDSLTRVIESLCSMLYFLSFIIPLNSPGSFIGFYPHEIEGKDMVAEYQIGML